MDERHRRTVGFALFGSAALLLVVALLIGTGTIDVDEDSRGTLSMALGGLGLLDALMAAYFVLSSTSSQ